MRVAGEGIWVVGEGMVLLSLVCVDKLEKGEGGGRMIPRGARPTLDRQLSAVREREADEGG